MTGGQVPRVSAQPVRATPAGGVSVSSALGSMGAVFSFFLIAEVEFIVLALPLALAGLTAGLANLRRVRGRQPTARRPADRAETAVGISLNGLAIAFCVAGLVFAALTLG